MISSSVFCGLCGHVLCLSGSGIGFSHFFPSCFLVSNGFCCLLLHCCYHIELITMYRSCFFLVACFLVAVSCSGSEESKGPKVTDKVRFRRLITFGNIHALLAVLEGRCLPYKKLLCSFRSSS